MAVGTTCGTIFFLIWYKQKKMQDLLVQGQQEQENEQQSKQDEIEESM